MTDKVIERWSPTILDRYWCNIIIFVICRAEGGGYNGDGEVVKEEGTERMVSVEKREWGRRKGRKKWS